MVFHLKFKSFFSDYFRAFACFREHKSNELNFLTTGTDLLKV